MGFESFNDDFTGGIRRITPACALHRLVVLKARGAAFQLEIGNKRVEMALKMGGGSGTHGAKIVPTKAFHIV